MAKEEKDKKESKTKEDKKVEIKTEKKQEENNLKVNGNLDEQTEDDEDSSDFVITSNRNIDSKLVLAEESLESQMQNVPNKIDKPQEEFSYSLKNSYGDSKYSDYSPREQTMSFSERRLDRNELGGVGEFRMQSAWGEKQEKDDNYRIFQQHPESQEKKRRTY